MRRATWVRGKQKLTGFWEYLWAADRFRILLDNRDRVTGSRRSFLVAGEEPEWGRWKLLKEGS